MGRRELCPHCLKEVTPAQLKKHLDEDARREKILSMRGDPDIPDVPMKFLPITGNDIFPLQAKTSPNNNDAFNFGTPPTPPPTSQQQSPALPHFVEDENFPSNVTEHPHPPDFPTHPSMETSDTGEDNSEGEDQDEGQSQKLAQHEQDLNEFMDMEFLKQSISHHLHCVHHTKLRILYNSWQTLRI
jgi:hypothetical protein